MQKKIKPFWYEVLWDIIFKTFCTCTKHFVMFKLLKVINKEQCHKNFVTKIKVYTSKCVRCGINTSMLLSVPCHVWELMISRHHLITCILHNNKPSLDSIHSLSTLKGKSDERQNQPILFANKIVRQKSVVCHAKIARFCRPTKFCRPR